MRVPAIILLMAVACTAGAEVYRWVDDSGQVHYTDTPPPRASERIDFAPGSAGDDARRDARRDSEATQAQRTAECSAARARRDQYTSATALVERGPDGRERELGPDEREAAVARAQAGVDRFCGEADG